MGERACLKKTKNLKEKNHLVGLGAFFLVLLFFAHSLTDTHTHMPPISLSLVRARKTGGGATKTKWWWREEEEGFRSLSFFQKKQKKEKTKKTRKTKRQKRGKLVVYTKWFCADGK